MHLRLLARAICKLLLLIKMLRNFRTSVPTTAAFFWWFCAHISGFFFAFSCFARYRDDWKRPNSHRENLFIGPFMTEKRWRNVSCTSRKARPAWTKNTFCCLFFLSTPDWVWCNSTAEFFSILVLRSLEKRRKIENERSVLWIFFDKKMKKKHASAVSFGWRQRRLSATISNRVSG